MKFEWDEQKNQLNQKKHGVAFEEAQEVFDDPFYVDFYDPEHSDDEHPLSDYWLFSPAAFIDCRLHGTP